MRFFQLVPLFSMLAIVCNHPHFLISYRLGYGRGFKFVRANWFSLIIVPLVLIAAYATAYFFYDTDFSDSKLIASLNHSFESLGLGFRLGPSVPLGSEIMGLSIWLMYLTVGWHYSKQVYGCMMVQAFYRGYTLGHMQKLLLKWSILSVGIFQFISMTRAMDAASQDGRIHDLRFQNFSFSELGLPDWLLSLSTWLMVTLATATVTMMVWHYQKTKQRPSVVFLTPWIAFYAWWVPIGELPEFYLLMVPFFHSLQYLPSAIRVQNRKLVTSKWHSVQVSIRTITLLLLGFAAFELVPSILDKELSTDISPAAWFFAAAFPIFINIHHFFIDSVVWKFHDSDVQKGLLYKGTANENTTNGLFVATQSS
ncbi:MAG: hypothetical protein IPJ84_14525 [Bdellovibrionales bacterium]|nr:hypothetical protein [Bdellovibrionales bacterium]